MARWHNSFLFIRRFCSYFSQIPTIGKLYLYFFPSSEVQFKPGPFNLGKFGYVVNFYAIAWYAAPKRVVFILMITLNYYRTLFETG